jgi:hypothetical protein
VNRIQQLPAELVPVPGKERERRFRVPILLNREKKNSVEIVLPPGVASSQENRHAFEIDCIKPEQGQRLHVMIIAPTEQDEHKLQERVQKALRLTLDETGKLATPVFDSFIVHSVLTGYHVTRRAINTQLYLIQEHIKQLKNSDLRANVKPYNDVVVIYFQGGETITREDHFLNTQPVPDDQQASRLGVTVDYLKEMMTNIPAASLLLLELTRTAPLKAMKVGPGADKLSQLPDTVRIGVVRTVWSAKTATPQEARLIPVLEAAISQERLLGEVLRHLDKRYVKVEDKYPGIFNFNAQAAGLLDLVVGVRP